MDITLQVKIALMKNLSSQFIALCHKDGINPMKLEYTFSHIRERQMYFSAIVPESMIESCEECHEPSQCSIAFGDRLSRDHRLVGYGYTSRVLCDCCFHKVYKQTEFDDERVSNMTFLEIDFDLKVDCE